MVTISNLIRRLLYVIKSPYYLVAWFRALSARDREDWPVVERRIIRLHAQGFKNSDSKLWLGIAQLEQRKWDEALRSFESIRGRPSSSELEGYRCVNHALALFMVGRKEESARMLRGAPSERWNDAQLRKARAILAECGEVEDEGTLRS